MTAVSSCSIAPPAPGKLDEMLSAADRLERLLDELGVTNGSGPYRPAGGYENPNDDVEDEAVDAEYESVDDSRS